MAEDLSPGPTNVPVGLGPVTDVVACVLKVRGVVAVLHALNGTKAKAKNTHAAFMRNGTVSLLTSPIIDGGERGIRTPGTAFDRTTV